MKDINLFEGIKKRAPQKKATRAVSFGLVLLILCAVVVGGIYGWFRYTQNGLDSQIQSLNQSIAISQSAASSNTGDLNTQKTMLVIIQSYNNTLTALDKNVQSYPKLNLALLKDIAGRMPSDVTAQSLRYDKGVLTLICYSGSLDSPANFAASLRKSAFIDSVGYIQSTVYIAQDQKTLDALAAGHYQFTVDCYLKGGAAQ